MGQSKITLESSTLDALLFNIKWELDTKPRQAFTFLSENTHFRRKNNVEVAETGNIETSTHIFCHLIPSQWRLVGTRGVLQHFVVNIWELTTTKRDHNFTGFSRSSPQNILHSKQESNGLIPCIIVWDNRTAKPCKSAEMRFFQSEYLSQHP